jgi:hypothetical protein
MPQFRHTEHYYGKRYKDTENKYAGSEVGAVTRQMSGLMACWSHKRIEMLRNETWLKKNEII